MPQKNLPNINSFLLRSKCSSFFSLILVFFPKKRLLFWDR